MTDKRKKLNCGDCDVHLASATEKTGATPIPASDDDNKFDILPNGVPVATPRTDGAWEDGN
jgi:hypothetical protein